MNPSLTRGEYWLLESVVEAKLPLRWLVSENLAQNLNKQSHGMPHILLLKTLIGLFERGWIVSHRGSRDEFFKLNRSEIETACRETENSHSNTMYYGLTKLGGKVWETFAQPNWNRFIDHAITCENNDGEMAEFICADEKLLNLYFNGIHYVGIIPKINTAQYDVLEPWQATYWKKLPRGFRVRFQCKTVECVSWDDVPFSYMGIYKKNWYQWD